MLLINSLHCCWNDFFKANNVPLIIFKLGSHCHPEKLMMAFSTVKCSWPFMVWSSYLFGLFCQHHKFTSLFRHFSLKFSVDFLLFHAISSYWGPCTFFTLLFFLILWVPHLASLNQFPLGLLWQVICLALSFPPL